MPATCWEVPVRTGFESRCVNDANRSNYVMGGLASIVEGDSIFFIIIYTKYMTSFTHDTHKIHKTHFSHRPRT